MSARKRSHAARRILSRVSLFCARSLETEYFLSLHDTPTHPLPHRSPPTRSLGTWNSPSQPCHPHGHRPRTPTCHLSLRPPPPLLFSLAPPPIPSSHSPRPPHSCCSPLPYPYAPPTVAWILSLPPHPKSPKLLTPPLPTPSLSYELFFPPPLPHPFPLPPRLTYTVHQPSH